MSKLKDLLNESQNPQAVEKTFNKVKEFLTKGEEIQFIAVQKKPALNLSPDSIALTNKRIIFCRPKTFGFSMDFQDYLWKEIADCHMKEGVLGATFLVKNIKGGQISLDYLPKAQARMLYRYAQEREEEMADYRRQRELEDSRAKAGGGIFVNTNDKKESSEETKEDPIAKLKNLKELLAENLISQNEFDTKKADILSKI
jgi:hypothetical protein